MKKAQIIMAVLATAFLAFANSAAAATFDSLAGFGGAPKVKQFTDAWTKCGQGGDNCPDKKSVADATRLRKEAIQDCFEAFSEDAPEKIGPCKAAINATPGAFSMKAGGVEPVKPAKPPVVVAKPQELTKPPEPVEPVIAPKAPEPQPEPAKPPVAVVKAPEPDVTPTDAPAPQMQARSDNGPGWRSLLILFVLVLGIMVASDLVIIHFMRGDRKRSAEMSADERGNIYLLQIEIEEQILEVLEAEEPQDPVEIRRQKMRIANLDFLKKQAGSTSG